MGTQSQAAAAWRGDGDFGDTSWGQGASDGGDIDGFLVFHLLGQLGRDAGWLLPCAWLARHPHVTVGSSPSVCLSLLVHD